MDLLSAGKMARRVLDTEEFTKEAVSAGDVGRGGAELLELLGRGIRGTGRAVQSGFTAAGREAGRAIGGVPGALAETALRVAPSAGVAGLGLYGLEEAAGNPFQRFVAAQKARFRRKMLESRAVRDPQSGMWY